MQISVSMDAEKVLGRLDSRPARMVRMIARWQEIVGPVVLGETQKNIHSRTGATARSLFAETSGMVVKIGSRSPIAAIVNNGSRAHTIRPIGAKALRFVIGGRVVFAKSVRHPGTKGQRFLQRALEAKKEFVIALLRQYTLQESQLLD